MQLPIMQRAPGLHSMSHAPQNIECVSVLTHPPLHSVCSPQPTLAATALPIEQICPLSIASPQPPQ